MSKVEINKKVNAPIETVWDAFTQKGQLKQWFSPAGMTNPVVEVDLTVGGKYRICMRNDKGEDYCAVGKFTKIDQPNSVEYSWAWESNEDEVTNVSIELKKVDDDTTEINFVHSGFPTDKEAENHNQGWVSAFDKLENVL